MCSSDLMVLWTCPATASAQEAAASRRPDPADPKLVVPAAKHDSAFANYRPFADQDVAPWRETNDNTARIGGWRTYARQAREPSPATPATPDKEHNHADR